MAQVAAVEHLAVRPPFALVGEAAVFELPLADAAVPRFVVVAAGSVVPLGLFEEPACVGVLLDATVLVAAVVASVAKVVVVVAILPPVSAEVWVRV